MPSMKWIGGHILVGQIVKERKVMYGDVLSESS